MHHQSHAQLPSTDQDLEHVAIADLACLIGHVHLPYQLIPGVSVLYQRHTP
jgi:hypothetical protein